MSILSDVPFQRDDRPSGRKKPGELREIRSEYQRDLDRVIYDYYFRRLGEITQVSSGSGKILRHNRMTHSLKVAQVGRRLVQYLLHESSNMPGIKQAGGLDADVVDAAGLLHDIGHPPFGHVAEEELNDIARRAPYHLNDGFEGNAQTLRIILSLATHRRRDENFAAPGMDLTHAVTAACVKYPWMDSLGSPRRKWGVYLPERQAFEQYVVPLLPAENTPTLEAEIMDWADDITYAVHDLQDFFVDGLIPLHQLKHSADNEDNTPNARHPTEMNDFWQYATEKLRARDDHMPPSAEARNLFGRYARRFPDRPYCGSREEKAAIGSLASEIISAASRATSVKDTGRLYVEPEMKAVISALKEITWFYVIDRPALISVQVGQRKKVHDLFDRLIKWVEVEYKETDTKAGGSTRGYVRDEKWIRQRRLPPELTQFINALISDNKNEGTYGCRQKDLVRGTLDYIASMTEREFDDMYIRLTRGELMSY
jgi:dGTPase